MLHEDAEASRCCCSSLAALTCEKAMTKRLGSFVDRPLQAENVCDLKTDQASLARPVPQGLNPLTPSAQFLSIDGLSALSVQEVGLIFPLGCCDVLIDLTLNAGGNVRSVRKLGEGQSLVNAEPSSLLPSSPPFSPS